MGIQHHCALSSRTIWSKFTLSGRSPPAGQCRKWMDWATSSVVEPFKAVFIGLVRTPPEQQDKVKIAQGMEKMNTLMSIANDALGEQAYLSGDAFGIGDIPLGCLAYAWFNLPIERPELPHLQRWYQSLTQRIAFQK